MKTEIRVFQSCLLMVVSLLLVSVSQAATPVKAETQVNLNSATEKELTALPGIGASTAQNIIAARPFNNVEDLQKVKGIGKVKFEALKDKITVGSSGRARVATATEKPSAPTAQQTGREAGKAMPIGPIDINTADQKTLEALPGIGAATARSIIAARPFKSVDDLQAVKGIGKAKFEAIKDKVIVGSGGRAKIATPTERPGATTAQPLGAVDINSADQKTLEALPGIGSATAQSIIAARPFKSVDDLQAVKGIGKAKFEAIKDKVIVGSGGRAKTVTPAVRPSATTAQPSGPEVKADIEGEKPAAPTRQTGRETTAAMPSNPIDINTADLKTLESLPGIGPVKAEAIIANRPYSKIEDIMKVPGIKEGIFAKIKDHIVVK